MCQNIVALRTLRALGTGDSLLALLATWTLGANGWFGGGG